MSSFKNFSVGSNSLFGQIPSHIGYSTKPPVPDNGKQQTGGSDPCFTGQYVKCSSAWSFKQLASWLHSIYWILVKLAPVSIREELATSTQLVIPHIFSKLLPTNKVVLGRECVGWQLTYKSRKMRAPGSSVGFEPRWSGNTTIFLPIQTQVPDKSFIKASSRFFKGKGDCKEKKRKEKKRKEEKQTACKNRRTRAYRWDNIVGETDRPFQQ